MSTRKFVQAFNDTLFHNSNALITIIGMQFIGAFLMNVLDPVMQWALPDRILNRFDILLPDNDDENDKATTIALSVFIRKVIMLVIVIAFFHFIV
jgi:hypothetical protein